MKRRCFEIRCSRVRIGVLKFIASNGGKASIWELYELVGILTKSKKSLLVLLKRYVKEGLIEVNEFGAYRITEWGRRYLKLCSGEELAKLEVR